MTTFCQILSRLWSFIKIIVLRKLMTWTCIKAVDGPDIYHKIFYLHLQGKGNYLPGRAYTMFNVMIVFYCKTEKQMQQTSVTPLWILAFVTYVSWHYHSWSKHSFFFKHAGKLHIIILIGEDRVIQRPKHTLTHPKTWLNARPVTCFEIWRAMSSAMPVPACSQIHNQNLFFRVSKMKNLIDGNNFNSTDIFQQFDGKGKKKVHQDKLWAYHSITNLPSTKEQISVLC